MEDWEKGLPFLQKSGHPKLSKCATEDLNATPASSEEVGNLWAALAEDAEFELYKTAIQSRAAHFHSKSKAVASGNGEKRAKPDETTNEASPTPGISIAKASFGHNKKWVDVTAALRKVLKRDPPVFVNSAAGMGVKDPIPNIRKRTRITYIIGGMKKTISLPAGPSRKFNLLEVLK